MPAQLPSQGGRFAQASDGSDIVINTQELSAVLNGGGRGSTLPVVLPFNTSVNLTQMQVVYPNRVINGPLTMSVAAGALAGCSATYSFTADGNNANVPTFPTPAFRQLTGSAGWVNTAGTTNVVFITYLDGVAYYSVSQTIADVVAPPVLDPNVETFILMTRRSTNVALSGTTYTADATGDIFATHGQSDIKLAGDGYVTALVNTLNTQRSLWGLSSAANAANSYVNWLYCAAQTPDPGWMQLYQNGVEVFTTNGLLPANALVRFNRVNGVTTFQSKVGAGAWTTLHTFSTTFTGNLFFNASWSANGVLANPRMFGAS